MTGKAEGVAWAVALAVAIPLFLVGVSAKDPCDAGGPSINGCQLDIPADLVIDAEETWSVDDGVLRFTNDSRPVALTVEGGLHLNNGAQIISKDGTQLVIEYRPGSSGSITDAQITGYDSFRIATDAFADPVMFHNVTLRGSDTALHIDDVPVVLDGVTVDGALDALDIRGSGADVRAIEGIFDAQREAVVATEGAQVRFEDTLWSGAITVEDTSDLTALWSVDVNATADQVGPIQVVFRDAHGDVQVNEPFTVGEEETVLVPGELHFASGVTEYAPYLVSFVQQGGHAAHAVLDFDRLKGTQIDMALQAHVSDDQDDDDPQWPSPDPLQQTGTHVGFSRDGNVSIAWDAADDTVDGTHPDRAVAAYQVVIDDGPDPEAVTRSTHHALTGIPPGVHDLQVIATDLVGNDAPSNTIQILVDAVTPDLQVAAEGAPPTGAFSGPVDFTVEAIDPTSQATPASGVSWLRWRIGDGSTTQENVSVCADPSTGQPCQFDVHLSEAGIHTLHVTAEDRAGNQAHVSQDIIIDTTPPRFIASIDPEEPAGGWHHTPPTLNIRFTDPGPSGPGSMQWRLDDGDWNGYTAPVLLDAPGDHMLHVEVTDGAGNTAQGQMRFAYDPEAPILDATVDGPAGKNDWYTGPATVEAVASDDASGLEQLEYRVGDGAWRPINPPPVFQEPGMRAITLRAVDLAGNEALRSLDLRIDLEPPTPPSVDWSVLPDGNVRADWGASPALDTTSGIATMRLERADASGEFIESYTVHDGTSVQVLVGLPTAEHRLRAVVQDVAGHEASTKWTTVQAGNKTTQNEEGPMKVRGSVPLAPTGNGTGGPFVEVQYRIDGVLVASQSDDPYEYSWDTTMLDNGIRQVRIHAVDAAGIHHEEVRVYDLRNGYAAALVDGAFPAVVAALSALAAAAVSVYGFRAWRREGSA